jgi:NhaA family Na+:H+ antiporter
MYHKILKPFEDFFKHEAAGGILLVIFAGIAMFWANSSLASSYTQILNYHISIGYGEIALSKSVLHWINDGLMAVFFFVVGMEIKRELAVGELKSFKKAILPIGAALGGMIVPAFIYFLFNRGTTNISGWGIPMATDIAFALGVLSLLGRKRAPKGLAVFLTALAIADDLGAILVIAFFYAKEIYGPALLVSAVIVLLLVLANKKQSKSILLFVVLGILLWLGVLKSGVHATIAGVILGMTIPVRQKEGDTETPLLLKMEHFLQPWAAFGILPLFALANAGVSVDFSRIKDVVVNPVSVGIILGLFLGKQTGIFGVSYIMIRLKIAKLPRYVKLKQLYGASLLGGIGFTMSIFITTLAFYDTNTVAIAKISIILASLLSAVVGCLVLVSLTVDKEAGVL